MTNGVVLPGWLDPKTLIVIVTVGAGFIGQWYVSNDNALDQQRVIETLIDRFEALDKRVDALELADARQATRLDYIADLVLELRRQAGVTKSSNSRP